MLTRALAFHQRTLIAGLTPSATYVPVTAVSRTVSSYLFKVQTKRDQRPFAQAMREGMRQHTALCDMIRRCLNADVCSG